LYAQKIGCCYKPLHVLILPGTGLPSGKTLTTIGPITYLLGTLGTAVKYCCTLVDSSSWEPNVFPPLLGLGPINILSHLKFSKQNPLDLTSFQYEQDIFFSPTCLGQVWGPYSFPSSWFWGLSSHGCSGQNVKLKWCLITEALLLLFFHF